MSGAAGTLRMGVVAGAVLVGTLAAAAPTASAQAASAQTWAGVLSGTQQVPPNASTASGFTSLTLVGNLLTVDVSWTGLTGGPLAAGHIHCCAPPGAVADVAVPFVGIRSTTTGSYNNTFDLLHAATYTSAFLAANRGTAASAEAALLGGLNAGRAYVNLHDPAYPDGEIRANVVTTPEPTTFALAALGLGGAGLLARRRRQG